MKAKLLTAASVLIAGWYFSQITLEKTLEGKVMKTYSNANHTFYYEMPQSIGFTQSLQVLNSDYTMRAIFSIIPPGGYESYFPIDIPNNYFISQYIFNPDEKLEFLIPFYKTTTNGGTTSADLTTVIFRIYNEDGLILKEFEPHYYYPIYINEQSASGDEFNYRHSSAIELFHDAESNKNKLKLLRFTGVSFDTEIWNLQTTSTLGIAELNNINAKLTAYPVPTDKTLNIINPKNGADRLEIYDLSGKIILSKNFLLTDKVIPINVENLPKGEYLYKIGTQSAKFIKN